MSFSSINAVRASGGLGGTTRQAPATFQGPPLAPQAPHNSAGPLQISSYTRGAGMMNSGPIQSAPLAMPPMQSNRAYLNNPIAQASAAGTANAHGVVAGQTQPSAVGPEQQVQFDPNDPNNAALAGYMAAR